jgi:hypothetical protein
VEKPILKLSAECQCWPLWLQQRPDVPFDTIDPETLPLSQATKQALKRWAEAFDAQYSLDDPFDALKGPEVDRAAFHQEGERIYRILRQELGDRYEIIYPGWAADGGA